MFNKKVARSKAEAKAIADRLYMGQKSGGEKLRPLRHKDGRKYSDYDYFNLLGAQVEKLEKANAGSRMPVDYKKLGFDPDCVRLAKRVREMRAEGYTESECGAYIAQCIIY